MEGQVEQEWQHPRPDFWFFGTDVQGGGVYPDKGGWCGNAVCGKGIRRIGPLPSLDEAKAAVEREYVKLIFLYN
jgi:hypothetical protein